MNKNVRKIISVVISIIIAYFLINYSLKGIDTKKSIEALKNANYIYILISVILGMFAYWLRSERWRLLLKPLGHNVSSINAFASVCMTYFSNLFIPRSGELIRCTTLKLTEYVPVDQSIGTVILERVIDFICLISVILLATLFNFDLILKLFNDLDIMSKIKSNNIVLTSLVIGILAVLALFFFLQKRIKNNLFFQKIKSFLTGIKEGVYSIKKLKKKKLFITYTLIIWIAYYFMTYLVVFALKESAHLSPAEGLFLLVVGGIGMIIPASGGIGAYHAAMRIGFLTLGLSGQSGVLFGFLVHTPHTLIALIFGILSILIIAKNKKPYG